MLFSKVEGYPAIMTNNVNLQQGQEVRLTPADLALYPLFVLRIFLSVDAIGRTFNDEF